MMADIGEENPRIVEFEPVPESVPVRPNVDQPAAPATPAPEPVPA